MSNPLLTDEEKMAEIRKSMAQVQSKINKAKADLQKEEEWIQNDYECHAWQGTWNIIFSQESGVHGAAICYIIAIALSRLDQSLRLRTTMSRHVYGRKWWFDQPTTSSPFSTIKGWNCAGISKLASQVWLNSVNHLCDQSSLFDWRRFAKRCAWSISVQVHEEGEKKGCIRVLFSKIDSAVSLCYIHRVFTCSKRNGENAPRWLVFCEDYLRQFVPNIHNRRAPLFARLET